MSEQSIFMDIEPVKEPLPRLIQVVPCGEYGWQPIKKELKRCTASYMYYGKECCGSCESGSGNFFCGGLNGYVNLENKKYVICTGNK